MELNHYKILIPALPQYFLLYFSVQKSIPPASLVSQVANPFHQINSVFPLKELPCAATTKSKKDVEHMLHIQSKITTTTKFNKWLSNKQPRGRIDFKGSLKSPCAFSPALKVNCPMYKEAQNTNHVWQCTRTSLTLVFCLALAACWKIHWWLTESSS